MDRRLNFLNAKVNAILPMFERREKIRGFFLPSSATNKQTFELAKVFGTHVYQSNQTWADL